MSPTRFGVGTPPPMELLEECALTDCHELPEWQLCGEVWAPGMVGKPATFKTGIVICDGCKNADRVPPIREMIPQDGSGWLAIVDAFESLGRVAPDYETLKSEWRPIL